MRFFSVFYLYPFEQYKIIYKLNNSGNKLFVVYFLFTSVVAEPLLKLSLSPSYFTLFLPIKEGVEKNEGMGFQKINVQNND